jgi:L-cysteine/cystine lyase
VEELRAQFPVLERVAYLNAGTNGPVPLRAFEAAEAELRQQLERGRSSKPWFEHQLERIDVLRERAAKLLGATQADVALTGSTTDGINAALHALDLKPGDEILTSEDEHPGVFGPIATARDTRGVRVRVVPFAELPGELTTDTRLVVTSHVSWATGQVLDTAPLADSDALVVLDGAQGLGAVPVDVRALGCDFYAASGQKWLCGPGGMGCPPPGAATTRWRTASARSSPRSSQTRAGSPRRSRSRTTWSGRLPPSTCSRRRASTRSTDAASPARSASPGSSPTAA